MLVSTHSGHTTGVRSAPKWIFTSSVAVRECLGDNGPNFQQRSFSRSHKISFYHEENFIPLKKASTETGFEEAQNFTESWGHCDMKMSYVVCRCWGRKQCLLFLGRIIWLNSTVFL